MLAPCDILYSFREMERKVPLHHLHAIIFSWKLFSVNCFAEEVVKVQSGVIVVILMLGAVYLPDQNKGTD